LTLQFLAAASSSHPQQREVKNVFHVVWFQCVVLGMQAILFGWDAFEVATRATLLIYVDELHQHQACVLNYNSYNGLLGCAGGQYD
jgi:hypothetical protein